MESNYRIRQRAKYTGTLDPCMCMANRYQKHLGMQLLLP